MKYTKYIISAFIGILVLASISTSLASTLQGYQGGTGYSTTTASNVGNFLQVASTSPYLTYTFGTSTGGTGTLSGNGTSTQIAFYTALQTLSSSLNLFWDNLNSRLGIGTSTPGKTLDVIGQTHISATTTVDGVILAGNNYTPYPEYSFGPDTNTGLDSTAPDVMNLVNGGTNTITMTSANRVGIGTSTPATKLVVNGTSTVTGNSIVSGQMTISSLGTGLVKSTSGAIGNATSGTDYQAPITFPLPYASTTPQTILGGTGISVSTSNGTSTITNTGVTSIVAGTNITVPNATGTVTINTTTTPSFTSVTYPDSTKQTTAYKDLAFNVYNTSSTTAVGASSTVQRIFYQAITLTQVDCSTDGSSITIQADIRSSSTPQTYGTSAFSGLVCSSTGVSTTTSANISAGQLLNFWESSVPNSTTTLRVNMRLKEQ